MRFRTNQLLSAGIILLMLAGCSGQDLPTAPPAGNGFVEKTDGSDPILVGGFVLTYEGRSYDGQQTTFYWRVAGAGGVDDLHWFGVELPDCAPTPVAWSPLEGAGFRDFEEYGFTGFKWLLGLDPQDYEGRQYTLTFPGDVPEGTIRSVVRTDLDHYLEEVLGPCGGFEIAGHVFTDADADGLRGANEGGIPDVIVEIVAATGAVDTVRTDADGRYSVRRSAGTYTVIVDTAGYPDAFNGTLGHLFSPTTTLSREVTVGPDAPDNDFGFTPNTAQIIQELENDTILANGESVKWWKQQVHAAIRFDRRDREPNANLLTRYYTPERIFDFITAIQALFLPEPYRFTPGEEFEEAYGILRRHPRTAYEDLHRELLASEFNHVSGRGLVGVAPALQDVLIEWGETLLNEAANQAAGASAEKADLDLTGAARLFRGINTGGGGGIDE